MSREKLTLQGEGLLLAFNVNYTNRAYRDESQVAAEYEFLDIFKPKAPPLFGMDIFFVLGEARRARRRGRGNPRVERYAIEALPKDAVLEGNITNLDAVVDAVQRGWKECERTKNVALALPTAA